LLKAVGWVESGWRQFDNAGRPLVAPDFGYGIMQITSGMPGAFGNVTGQYLSGIAGQRGKRLRVQHRVRRPSTRPRSRSLRRRAL